MEPQNKPTEEPSGSPWEKVWDNVKGALVEGSKAVVEPIKQIKMPWEKSPDEINQLPSRGVKGKVTDSQFDQIFNKLIHAESKSTHTDKNGKLITSEAGAEGITQLMKKTAKNPGYGVEPVKDNSEQEYLRFGKDYLKALVNEFDGDYRKAVAAYNAGPGSIKRAIAKGGDKWEEHLPKPSETKPYMKKILGE